MILDDKIAFNLIIELMQIRNEKLSILETQKWVNDVGLEKVFDLVVYMHTEIKERMVEYPYDCKSEEYARMEDANDKEN